MLAAINEIETDYGRNLAVSSAGALGWMQFMPATWQQYGVDADHDGVKDPNDPDDAIFAAARYLKAAGAERGSAPRDLRLQPCRLVRRLRPRTRRRHRHDAVGRDRVAHRPRPGPLAVGHAYRTSGDWTHGAASACSPRRARASSPPMTAGSSASGAAGARGASSEVKDRYGNTYVYGRLGRVAGATAKGGRLRREARVPAGATLGRVRPTAHDGTSSMRFAIRPAGRGAPRIDPRPILRGWKLTGTAATTERPGAPTRARRRRARPDPRDEPGSAGCSRARRLADRRLRLRPRRHPRRGDRPQGARDTGVARGIRVSPDRLVAAMRASVTTTSGNISEHSTGSAVDIAAINGVPILGHQGAGSITEVVVRRLLELQGPMKPHQIITLMRFAGTDNTFAMGDHNDHIHIGWRALPGSSTSGGGQAGAVLKPEQWSNLVDRLGHIKTPKIAASPSKYAIKAIKRGPNGHPRVKVTKRSR